MALVPTGKETRDLTHQRRFSHDSEKNSVIISGTIESIDDYGWHTVWQAAETKYQAGDYEQSGDHRIVQVTTTDCKAEDDARP